MINNDENKYVHLSKEPTANETDAGADVVDEVMNDVEENKKRPNEKIIFLRTRKERSVGDAYGSLVMDDNINDVS